MMPPTSEITASMRCSFSAFAHRIDEPARRVETKNHGAGADVLRVIEAVFDVCGADRMDDVVEVDLDDARRRRRGLSRAESHHKDTKTQKKPCFVSLCL